MHVIGTKNGCTVLGTRPMLSDLQRAHFESLTLAELREEKRAALSLLKQFERGSYLYELTMLELGCINQNISFIERIEK